MSNRHRTTGLCEVELPTHIVRTETVRKEKAFSGTCRAVPIRDNTKRLAPPLERSGFGRLRKTMARSKLIHDPHTHLHNLRSRVVLFCLKGHFCIVATAKNAAMEACFSPCL